MAIKLEDIGLQNLDTGIVETNAVQAYPFDEISNDLGQNDEGGYVVRKLSGLQAFGVAPGGKKLATGKAEVKTIHLNKIAVRTVIEEEAFGTKGLFTALTQELPAANSEYLTSVILGLKPVPEAWGSNIETLGTLEAHEIGEGHQAAKDFVAARGKVARGKITALVCTREFLNYLTSQFVEQTGQPAFNYDSVNETLNHIPVKVVDIPGNVGYFGNWKKSWTRLQPFPSKLTGELIRLNDSGTVETFEGDTINLLDNQIAATY